MTLGEKFAELTGQEVIPDAVSLLKQDHDDVSALLKEYERAQGASKKSIAQRICKALSVHAQIEEEIFYPAARQALGEDGKDLLNEADVEHATIKGLVSRIERSSLSDEHYDAYVTVLGEYVKHHVKEEESQLFPKVRRSDMDGDAVGAKLVARKQELSASA